MRYELVPNSNRGVLFDRTPILQDMRDTYEVSFLLPDYEPYICIFKGKDGIEYRKAITEGKCKVPKELLKNEQYIEVRVCKIDNNKILQTWECEPLKVTAMLHMRKSQLELSGGMTDKDLYQRLADFELLCVELRTKIAEQQAAISNLILRIETAEQKLADREYDEIL